MFSSHASSLTRLIRQLHYSGTIWTGLCNGFLIENGKRSLQPTLATIIVLPLLQKATSTITVWILCCLTIEFYDYCITGDWNFAIVKRSRLLAVSSYQLLHKTAYLFEPHNGEW
jgi:hypothetical protein